MIATTAAQEVVMVIVRGHVVVIAQTVVVVIVQGVAEPIAYLIAEMHVKVLV